MASLKWIDECVVWYEASCLVTSLIGFFIAFYLLRRGSHLMFLLFCMSGFFSLFLRYSRIVGGKALGPIWAMDCTLAVAAIIAYNGMAITKVERMLLYIAATFMTASWGSFACKRQCLSRMLHLMGHLVVVLVLLLRLVEEDRC